MSTQLFKPQPPPRNAATPGPDPGFSAMRPVPPPNVAQGSPGRPPEPQPSPPAGPQPPPFGATPAPAEAPRATPPTPGPAPAGAPATKPNSLSTNQPQPGAVAPAAQLTRVPTSEEFRALGPGATVQTPWGQVVADEMGEPRLVLDENGRAADTAAKARSIQRFGVLPAFAQTPGAPPPPIEVGRANFNPFEGRWSGNDDLQ